MKLPQDCLPGLSGLSGVSMSKTMMKSNHIQKVAHGISYGVIK